jgi:drug/metabolite transporter (DMT)-like permease
MEVEIDPGAPRKKVNPSESDDRLAVLRPPALSLCSSPRLGDKSAMTAPPSTAARRANAAAIFAVAITVLSWASAFPMIRFGMRDLGPLELAAARFAIASLLALAWLAIYRPPVPTRGDIVRFVICGLIGISAYNGLLNQGERTVGAGAAAFIVNIAPILTAILATIFLRERFSPWGWSGALISFAGVGLIALGQPGGLAFGGGASLVAGAALCTSGYFVIQRPLVPRYGALACTAYTLLAGALFLLPFLAGALPRLFSPGAAPLAATVVALGVFPAAIGYAAWTYALGRFGAARAANFLYLVPPVAAMVGYAALGERLSALTLIGGAIAILGVVIVNSLGRPSANDRLAGKVGPSL